AEAGPLLLHVNLSAHHLLRNDLAAHVAAALRDSGLPPECLALEITESVLMHDLEVAIVRLHELKGLGVHLAIDDFGTGYSSLAYLGQMPIDAVQIDKSFVDGVAGGAAGAARGGRGARRGPGPPPPGPRPCTWTPLPRGSSSRSRPRPWPPSAATSPRGTISPPRSRPPTWAAWPSNGPSPSTRSLASATRPEQPAEGPAGGESPGREGSRVTEEAAVGFHSPPVSPLGTLERRRLAPVAD